MTIRHSVIAKCKATRAQICMHQQRVNREKRHPTTKEQRLINSLSDREIRTWRLAGRPRKVGEIKAAVWPLADPEFLADRFARRGVAV